MSILDKAKIGGKVLVNLEISRDRLNKNTIDAISHSSKCTIRDFRITDGKGIGVVLKLPNGKEQWFFENEIDILDEDGNVIEKDIDKNLNTNLILQFLKNLKYENKKNPGDLLNPVNFINWLLVSFKDIL